MLTWATSSMLLKVLRLVLWKTQILKIKLYPEQIFLKAWSNYRKLSLKIEMLGIKTILNKVILDMRYIPEIKTTYKKLVLVNLSLVL